MSPLNLEKEALRSEVRRLLRWWSTELASLVPQSVKTYFDDEEVKRLRLDMFEEGPGGSFGVPSSGKQITLLIDVTAAMRKILFLPREVERRLGDIVCSDIERITPYKRDELYFDFRQIETLALGKISIEVLAIEKSTVDLALERAGCKGGDIKRIDLYDGQNRLKVNLLRFSERKRVKFSKYLPAMALVALILCGLVQMQLGLDSEVEHLSQRIELARPKFNQAMQLSQKIDVADQSQRLFISRRRDARPLLETLNDLAIAMPDSAHLRELSVQGTNLTIRGRAGDSTALVKALEAAPSVEQVRLRSVVIDDAVLRTERFEIQTQIKGRLAK